MVRSEAAPTPSRLRSRAVRAAAALGVLVLLALAAIQAGATWWMNARFAARVNRSPERLLVTWSSVRYDVLRGARVRGLRVRGQTHRVQWELQVDEARCDVGLLALREKRLRFEGMRAHGVVLRIRRFVPAGDPSVPFSPPIAGVPPPFLENAPPRRPAPAKRWTYEFDDCSASDVREIWIGPWRLENITNVEVEHVASRVRELLEIDGARVATEAATLSRRDVRVADAMALTTELSVLGYDRATSPPREMVDHAEGRVAGSARIRELELGDARFPNLPWLGFGGARGALDVDVRVEGGVIAPGSRFTLAADDFVATAMGYRASGTAAVAGHVADAGGATGTMTVTLGEYRIARDGREQALAEGDGMVASVITRDLRLLDLLRRYQVELDVPAAHIADVGEIDASIPATVPLELRGGTGTLVAHLRATEGASNGTMRLDLVDVDVATRGVNLRGGLVLDAVLSDVRLDAMTFDVAGSRLGLRDFVLQDGRRKVRGWSAEVTMTRGVLNAKGRAFEGELHARLDDMRPVIALVSAVRDLPPMAGRLLQGRDVDLRLGLSTWPEALDVRDAVLTADGLEARGCLRQRGAERVGYFWFDSGLVSAGVRLAADGAHVRPLAGRKWVAARRADCE